MRPQEQPPERVEPVSAEQPPHSSVTKRRQFSLIWLVPVVAIALVAYLAYATLAKRGPSITVHFKEADGLVVDQTQLKYKDVPLGMVEEVELGANHAEVIVHLKLDRSAKFAITDRARFWVVRPRLSLANISGLETLVSGAYIAVDPGTAGGKTEHNFTGLEEPPGMTSDEPGHTFELKANRVGSLGAGAPVFYRDVTVGTMLKYDLGDGTGPVSMHVFIRAPYDKLVHTDTIFWNASGISLKMGSDGMHLELESMQAVLSGGIAFMTPTDTGAGPIADNGPPFPLYDGKAKAEAALYQQHTPCVTYLTTSVEGLERGSPVEIFGVQVGTVQNVHLIYGGTTKHFNARVAFDLEPARMPKSMEYLLADKDLRVLVADGLGVVLESNSFLTGQKVLTLQYATTGHGAIATQEGDAIVIPGRGGGLDGITSSASEIMAKIDKIPFDEIGNHVNEAVASLSQTLAGPDMKSAVASLSSTLKEANHLVHEADTDLTPALQRLPAIAGELQTAVEHARDALGAGGYGADSTLQRNLQRMLDEASQAARTIRLLADFLDHHPESLIRGRNERGTEK